MMPDFLRIFINLFFLNAPHYVLCSVPFFPDLRVKKRTVISMILATAVVLSTCRTLLRLYLPDPYQFDTLVLVVFYLLYFIQYKFCFRVSTAKLLYIFFVVQEYSSLLNVAGKFIELQFFPDRITQGSTLLYTLIVVLEMVATYPFLFWFFKRIFSRVFHEYADKGFWKLCIAPALYFVIIMIYTTVLPLNLVFSGWQMFMVFLLIVLTGLVTHYISLRIGVDMADKTRRQAEVEGQLALQAQRFQQLTETIEHARAARHDLRHHLSVISNYVNDGNYDGLRAYLNDYTGNLPEDAIAPLCQNYAVDAVARHYLDRARAAGVELDIQFQLPQKTGLPDSDLCIVFGSILENAVESCLRQKEGHRFIAARCEALGRRVVLTVDNSGSEEPAKGKPERYKGMGVGLGSVAAVAEKHDGSLDFRQENGVYKTSVILMTNR